MVWEQRIAGGKKIDVRKVAFTVAHVLAIGPEGHYRLGRRWRYWPGLSWEAFNKELGKFGILPCRIAESVFNEVAKFRLTHGPIKRDRLGNLLRLTEAERVSCQAWNIRSVDKDAHKARERRLAQKRRADRRARRAANGMSRAKYLAQFAEAAEARKKEGISIRTQQRRRKAALEMSRVPVLAELAVPLCVAGSCPPRITKLYHLGTSAPLQSPECRLERKQELSAFPSVEAYERHIEAISFQIAREIVPWLVENYHG